jgi:hypothetical protein
MTNKKWENGKGERGMQTRDCKAYISLEKHIGPIRVSICKRRSSQTSVEREGAVKLKTKFNSRQRVLELLDYQGSRTPWALVERLRFPF